jgi:putative glutathione S-transferase
VHPYRSFFLPRRVYPSINNGVYRSGFAATQKAYEEAVTELFGALDRVEGILKDGREYLIGGKLTEADVRLYTTIVRFDIVYHGHFKCNLGSSESGFLSPLHLAGSDSGHALIISYTTLPFLSAVRHDYPALNRWLKNLYWNNAAFKDTTDFETSKEHYYFSHKQINGSQVVPIGPKYPVEPL